MRHEPVAKVDFSTIREARDFVKDYSDVEGMPIYGMTNFVYPFIFDHFRSDIVYDAKKISVVSLDIENNIGELEGMFLVAIEVWS